MQSTKFPNSCTLPASCNLRPHPPKTEEEIDDRVRLLLVTFLVQGQINPSLQFTKRLVQMGVSVTFVTAFSALNRITKSASATPQGLTFSGYSDGYDDGSKFANPMGKETTANGLKAIEDIIKSEAERGQPFIHVVYTTFLPWVGQIARAFDWGALPLLEEHVGILNDETNPKVLVNTFEALESGALRAIEKLNLVAVGPLIPSAF
ncbi:hypothetical protein RHSIM_RhsimUnG0245000 [Rhododendron simsii]|uniref:Uncharacterized protein n=1 Tax=Rhododendron simsii TaxID=118357 RepID=A0A834FTF6_RHOSS|nr:hypothetical protein RHSIM_RhsimUnG0245000 [Rhododendron simsii]